MGTTYKRGDHLSHLTFDGKGKTLFLLEEFLFRPALLRYTWQIKIVYLRDTIWWLDICLHCGRITTIKIINTSITLHSYHYVVRTLKIYSISSIQYSINNYSHHAIYYNPRTSSYNCKFVPFDYWRRSWRGQDFWLTHSLHLGNQRLFLPCHLFLELCSAHCSHTRSCF